MLKVKLLSKPYHSEYAMTYSQSTIAHCGKKGHKNNEVNFFSSSQNSKEGGTIDEKSETKIIVNVM